MCYLNNNIVLIIIIIALSLAIINITSYGKNTVGESFALECSINKHSAKVQWTEKSGTLITSGGSRMIISSSFSSRLEFVQLYESHNGTYMCKVSVAGVNVSESATLLVNGM